MTLAVGGLQDGDHKGELASDGDLGCGKARMGPVRVN